MHLYVCFYKHADDSKQEMMESLLNLTLTLLH